MARIVQVIQPTKNIGIEYLNVCAYARVSSGKDAMLHSLSAQISYYQELIQKQPGWKFCGIYADEAMTGTKENRKKFQEMLEETIKQYHERRKHLTAEEAGEAQEQATEDIIKYATEQALRILKDMNADRESFRKIGLTFEEKAFYDILMALRDEYNFEYGTDKKVDGIVINDKCKSLAKKIKEIIDTKSSFADWLNNQIVRDQLKFDIKVCLIKNGYPPQYSPEVFRKVMEQVENFEENN